MNVSGPWPEKANKRTAAQKEADALFIEERILEGLPYGEIAERLSAERPYTLSKSQVFADARKIEARWREQCQALLETNKGRHLAALDVLTRKAWAAWRQSDGKEPATLRLLLDIERQRARVYGLEHPPTKLNGVSGEFPACPAVPVVEIRMERLPGSTWEEKVKFVTGQDIPPPVQLTTG
jgi:hypothetical protein